MMDEVKRSAFVAGATGYTGREVVRQLCEKGVRTVAHVRPDSPRLDEWREQFGAMGARVDVTAWDKEAMVSTLKHLGPSYVFGLLGTIRARMKQARKEGRDPRSESYEEIDYGLTMILVQASQACEPRPKFVYLSAVGVNEHSNSAYNMARAKVESALSISGLAYCVARPSFITGPDRDDGRPLERIGATAIDGLLSLASLFGAKKLRARYTSTTNVILAEAMVGMALNPDMKNTILESEELRQGRP